MRRVGFTWWELLAWIAGLVLIIMMIMPLNKKVRDTSSPPPCSNNLRQISLALAHYNQDFNQRLPLIVYPSKTARTKQAGWVETLLPYHRQYDIYRCPQGFAHTYGRTDYWFNSNLSGFKTNSVKVKSSIIVFGDGNDTTFETTSAYNLNSLPPTWINNPKSPAYRHKGMANYAFLDGHVKALPPDQITNEPLTNGKPTFAVK